MRKIWTKSQQGVNSLDLTVSICCVLFFFKQANIQHLGMKMSCSTVGRDPVEMWRGSIRENAGRNQSECF